ncbi:hypothetical protein HJC23_013005 [Cyclotella cryptica]|uniref:Uncharacterized protein n=1 Tax=Cyclotella cryptica TaxID=29204 RepID=A0ABD3QFT4_9STRA|eukprot:CCRYP_005604-RA/>CCRYP_005604-RA protein AED:0.36 eAED:0.36 QI:105/1/1/1/1/1/2/225/122
MGSDDAVDESKLVLCCALCCANLSTYLTADCLGCSGKVGLCCLNCEVCCKPGAPCLPCCCIGPACNKCDGCSCCNMQTQCCCCVASAALPCNDEVPVAVSILGLTLYPKCGCMVPMKKIMER